MIQHIVKIGRRTFSSLSVRNYRLYFFGQAISLSGTWMQTVAQSWLVLKLTGSGTALGVITAMQFLPILLFGVWGGVIADRFSKRRILFVTQSVSGILALVLGVLVAADMAQLWMVGVLAFLLGLVNAVDNPTRQTFILEMVEEDHFPNAVSLNSTQVNIARVAGPALGGVLIATAGLAACFLINAASYIAVLFALWLMRPHELFPTLRHRTGAGRLREGFRYIASTPLVRDTLLMMAIVGTLSFEFIVTLPLIAEFTFHRGATGYAALMSAMGAGSAAGGLYTAHRRRHTPSMLLNAALLFGVLMLVAAAAPTFEMAMAAMVLVGFFSINFLSMGNILLQLESRPDMRGRVMALWTVALLGSTPIGGPIVGWIGEYAGPRWGLVMGGVAAIAAAVMGIWRFGRDKNRNMG
jgi:MFS family permease